MCGALPVFCNRPVTDESSKAETKGAIPYQLASFQISSEEDSEQLPLPFLPRSFRPLPSPVSTGISVRNRTPAIRDPSCVLTRTVRELQRCTTVRTEFIVLLQSLVLCWKVVVNLLMSLFRHERRTMHSSIMVPILSYALSGFLP